VKLIITPPAGFVQEKFVFSKWYLLLRMQLSIQWKFLR